MLKALDRCLPKDPGELAWTGVLAGAFGSQVCGPGILALILLLPDSVWVRVATVVLLVAACAAAALSFYIGFRAHTILNRRIKETESGPKL